MRDDYWEQSTQPLGCLCFVVPLLLLYEMGTMCLGPEAMRNGADIWLRQGLAHCGLVQFFLLPTMLCGWLLGWQHLSRRPWSLHAGVVSGMVCESFALGVVLIVLAQLLAHAMHTPDVAISTANVVAHAERIPHCLSYLGAGIYEELLFRLLLLSGTLRIMLACGLCKQTATVFAVSCSSLLFAASHYQLFCAVGLSFSWFSFLFRVLAGVFFSLLFLRRGFGIAVGTHAVYDILVVSAY